MKKNLVVIVMMVFLLMPSLVFSVEYVEGKEILVCHHEDTLIIVADAEQCPGVVHEATVRGMVDGMLTVQIGDQLLQVPMETVNP